MATEDHIPEFTSITKGEGEGKSLTRMQLDATVDEELKKDEGVLNEPPETEYSMSKENMQVANDIGIGTPNTLNKGNVGTSEGEIFLESPSVSKVACEEICRVSEDCRADEIPNQVEKEIFRNETKLQNYQTLEGAEEMGQVENEDMKEIKEGEEKGTQELGETATHVNPTPIQGELGKISIGGCKDKEAENSFLMGKGKDAKAVEPNEQIENEGDERKKLPYGGIGDVSETTVTGSEDEESLKEAGITFKLKSQYSIVSSEKPKDVVIPDEEEIQDKNKLDTPCFKQTEDQGFQKVDKPETVKEVSETGPEDINMQEIPKAKNLPQVDVTEKIESEEADISNKNSLANYSTVEETVQIEGDKLDDISKFEPQEQVDETNAVSIKEKKHLEEVTEACQSIESTTLEPALIEGEKASTINAEKNERDDELDTQEELEVRHVGQNIEQEIQKTEEAFDPEIHKTVTKSNDTEEDIIDENATIKFYGTPCTGNETTQKRIQVDCLKEATSALPSEGKSNKSEDDLERDDITYVEVHDETKITDTIEDTRELIVNEGGVIAVSPEFIEEETVKSFHDNEKVEEKSKAEDSKEQAMADSVKDTPESIRENFQRDEKEAEKCKIFESPEMAGPSECVASDTILNTSMVQPDESLQGKAENQVVVEVSIEEKREEHRYSVMAEDNDDDKKEASRGKVEKELISHKDEQGEKLAQSLNMMSRETEAANASECNEKSTCIEEEEAIQNLEEILEEEKKDTKHSRQSGTASEEDLTSVAVASEMRKNMESTVFKLKSEKGELEVQKLDKDYELDCEEKLEGKDARGEAKEEIKKEEIYDTHLHKVETTCDGAEKRKIEEDAPIKDSKGLGEETVEVSCRGDEDGQNSTKEAAIKWSGRDHSGRIDNETENSTNPIISEKIAIISEDTEKHTIKEELTSSAISPQPTGEETHKSSQEGETKEELEKLKAEVWEKVETTTVGEGIEGQILEGNTLQDHPSVTTKGKETEDISKDDQMMAKIPKPEVPQISQEYDGVKDNGNQIIEEDGAAKDNFEVVKESSAQDSEDSIRELIEVEKVAIELEIEAYGHSSEASDSRANSNPIEEDKNPAGPVEKLEDAPQSVPEDLSNETPQKMNQTQIKENSNDIEDQKIESVEEQTIEQGLQEGEKDTAEEREPRLDGRDHIDEIQNANETKSEKTVKVSSYVPETLGEINKEIVEEAGTCCSNLGSVSEKEEIEETSLQEAHLDDKPLKGADTSAEEKNQHTNTMTETNPHSEEVESMKLKQITELVSQLPAIANENVDKEIEIVEKPQADEIEIKRAPDTVSESKEQCVQAIDETQRNQTVEESEEAIIKEETEGRSETVSGCKHQDVEAVLEDEITIVQTSTERQSEKQHQETSPALLSEEQGHGIGSTIGYSEDEKVKEDESLQNMNLDDAFGTETAEEICMQKEEPGEAEISGLGKELNENIEKNKLNQAPREGCSTVDQVSELELGENVSAIKCTDSPAEIDKGVELTSSINNTSQEAKKDGENMDSVIPNKNANDDLLPHLSREEILLEVGENHEEASNKKCEKIEKASEIVFEVHSIVAEKAAVKLDAGAYSRGSEYSSLKNNDNLTKEVPEGAKKAAESETIEELIIEKERDIKELSAVSIDDESVYKVQHSETVPSENLKVTDTNTRTEKVPIKKALDEEMSQDQGSEKPVDVPSSVSEISEEMSERVREEADDGVSTSSQGKEVDSIKLEESSELVSQLAAVENTVKEGENVEKPHGNKVEETKGASDTVSESKELCAEEIDETQKCLMVEKSEKDITSEEIEEETVSESKHQGFEAVMEEGIPVVETATPGKLEEQHVLLSKEKDPGVSGNIGHSEDEKTKEDETPQNDNVEDSFTTKTAQEICLQKEEPMKLEISALGLQLNENLQKNNLNESPKEECSALDEVSILEPREDVSDIKCRDSIDSALHEAPKDDNMNSGIANKNANDVLPHLPSEEISEALDKNCKEAIDIERQKFEKASDAISEAHSIIIEKATVELEAEAQCLESEAPITKDIDNLKEEMPEGAEKVAESEKIEKLIIEKEGGIKELSAASIEEAVNEAQDSDIVTTANLRVNDCNMQTKVNLPVAEDFSKDPEVSPITLVLEETPQLQGREKTLDVSCSISEISEEIDKHVEEADSCYEKFETSSERVSDNPTMVIETGSENKTPQTENTTETSPQGEEVDSTKLEETSELVSQLPAIALENTEKESETVEKPHGDEIEESKGAPDTVSESKELYVDEEIVETQKSVTVEKSEEEIIKEVIHGPSETVSESKYEGVEAVLEDKITTVTAGKLEEQLQETSTPLLSEEKEHEAIIGYTEDGMTKEDETPQIENREISFAIETAKEICLQNEEPRELEISGLGQELNKNIQKNNPNEPPKEECSIPHEVPYLEPRENVTQIKCPDSSGESDKVVELTGSINRALQESPEVDEILNSGISNADDLLLPHLAHEGSENCEEASNIEYQKIDKDSDTVSEVHSVVVEKAAVEQEAEPQRLGREAPNLKNNDNLTEEVPAEAERVAESENIEKLVIEKKIEIKELYALSTEDESVIKEQLSDTVLSEGLQVNDSNMQTEEVNLEAVQDLSKDPEGSPIKKSLEERISEIHGSEKPVVVSSSASEISEEIHKEVTEEEDTCHKKFETASEKVETEETSLRDAWLDDEALKIIETRSEDKTPTETSTHGDDSVRLAEIHESQLPGIAVENADKENETLEKLHADEVEEIKEASDTVSESKEMCVERVHEAKKSITEANLEEDTITEEIKGPSETESEAKYQVVEAVNKEEISDVENAMGRKSEEQQQETSTALVSEEQDHEIAATIEGTEDGKAKEVEIPENENREDSFATKTAEEICLKNEKLRELEISALGQELNENLKKNVLNESPKEKCSHLDEKPQLEPQENVSEIECTDSSGESKKLVELTGSIQSALQETPDDDEILNSRISNKNADDVLPHLSHEGTPEVVGENCEEASNIERQKIEKDSDTTSEVHSIASVDLKAETQSLESEAPNLKSNSNLIEEVPEGAEKAAESENVEKLMIEKQEETKELYALSTEDESVNKEQLSDTVLSEGLRVNDSNMQTEEVNLEAVQDLSKDPEGSPIKKSLEERISEIHGSEKPVVVSSSASEISEEIHRAVTEEEDTCHKKFETASEKMETEETSLRDAWLDDEALKIIETRSEDKTPTETSTHGDDSVKLAEIHESQLPGIAGENADKENETLEKLHADEVEEIKEASDTVSESKELCVERVHEAKKSITEANLEEDTITEEIKGPSETESEAKYQVVEAVNKEEISDVENAMGRKSEEQQQETSTALVSEEQDHEIAATIEGTEDGKAKEVEIPENENLEDSFATKTAEEICLKNEKLRELEISALGQELNENLKKNVLNESPKEKCSHLDEIPQLEPQENVFEIECTDSSGESKKLVELTGSIHSALQETPDDDEILNSRISNKNADDVLPHISHEGTPEVVGENCEEASNIECQKIEKDSDTTSEVHRIAAVDLKAETQSLESEAPNLKSNSDLIEEVPEGAEKAAESENVEKLMIEKQEETKECSALSTEDESDNKVHHSGTVPSEDVRVHDSNMQTEKMNLEVVQDLRKDLEGSPIIKASEEEISDIHGSEKPVIVSSAPEISEEINKVIKEADTCYKKSETASETVETEETSLREAQLDDKPLKIIETSPEDEMPKPTTTTETSSHGEEVDSFKLEEVPKLSQLPAIACDNADKEGETVERPNEDDVEEIKAASDTISESKELCVERVHEAKKSITEANLEEDTITEEIKGPSETESGAKYQVVEAGNKEEISDVENAMGRKSEEQQQETSTALVSEEQDHEIAATIEGTEDGKAKEVEIPENENLEDSFATKTAEEICLKNEKLRELEISALGQELNENLKKNVLNESPKEECSHLDEIPQLEPQENVSEIECTDSSGESKKLVELTGSIHSALQETPDDDEILNSRISNKNADDVLPHLSHEGTPEVVGENCEEASNIERQKIEKDSDTTSEVHSIAAVDLKAETQSLESEAPNLKSDSNLIEEVPEGAEKAAESENVEKLMIEKQEETKELSAPSTEDESDNKQVHHSGTVPSEDVRVHDSNMQTDKVNLEVVQDLRKDLEGSPIIKASEEEISDIHGSEKPVVVSSAPEISEEINKEVIKEADTCYKKSETASETVETEETSLREAQLDDKPLKIIETSPEDEMPKTTTTTETSSHGEEVDSFKLEEVPKLSQLPAIACDNADKEGETVERPNEDDVEEIKAASDTLSVSKEPCIEEIDGTLKSLTEEKSDQGIITEEIKESVSEAKYQAVETVIQEEITAVEIAIAGKSEEQLQESSIALLSAEQDHGTIATIGCIEDGKTKDEIQQNENQEDSRVTKTAEEICLHKEKPRELEISALGLEINENLQKNNPNEPSKDECSTLDEVSQLEPLENVSAIKSSVSPVEIDKVMELTRSMDNNLQEAIEDGKNMESVISNKNFNDDLLPHLSCEEILLDVGENHEEASNIKHEKIEKASETGFKIHNIIAEKATVELEAGVYRHGSESSSLKKNGLTEEVQEGAKKSAESENSKEEIIEESDIKELPAICARDESVNKVQVPQQVSSRDLRMSESSMQTEIWNIEVVEDYGKDSEAYPITNALKKEMAQKQNKEKTMHVSSSVPEMSERNTKEEIIDKAEACYSNLDTASGKVKTEESSSQEGRLDDKLLKITESSSEEGTLQTNIITWAEEVDSMKHEESSELASLLPAIACENRNKDSETVEKPHAAEEKKGDSDMISKSKEQYVEEIDEAQRSLTVEKSEEDKITEEIKEETASEPQHQEVEAVIEEEITVVQTAPVGESGEQHQEKSTAWPSVEQGHGITPTIGHLEGGKRKEDDTLQNENQEDSLSSKTEQEICLQKEEPRELEISGLRLEINEVSQLDPQENVLEIKHTDAPSGSEKVMELTRSIDSVVQEATKDEEKLDSGILNKNNDIIIHSSTQEISQEMDENCEEASNLEGENFEKASDSVLDFQSTEVEKIAAELEVGAHVHGSDTFNTQNNENLMEEGAEKAVENEIINEQIMEKEREIKEFPAVPIEDEPVNKAPQGAEKAVENENIKEQIVEKERDVKELPAVSIKDEQVNKVQYSEPVSKEKLGPMDSNMQTEKMNSEVAEDSSKDLEGSPCSWKLEVKPPKGIDASAEGKILERNITTESSLQGEEVEYMKVEEISEVVSQLPAIECKNADKEGEIVEEPQADEAEETKGASDTVPESRKQFVEEIDETQKSLAVEKLEENIIKEEIKGPSETVSECKYQDVEAVVEDNTTAYQAVKAQKPEEQLQEICTALVYEEQEHGINTITMKLEDANTEEDKTCFHKESRELEVSELGLELSDDAQKKTSNEAPEEEGNSPYGVSQLKPQEDASKINCTDSPAKSAMELTRSIDCSLQEGSKDAEKLDPGLSIKNTDDVLLTLSGEQILQEVGANSEETCNLGAEKIEKASEIQIVEVEKAVDESGTGSRSHETEASNTKSNDNVTQENLDLADPGVKLGRESELLVEHLSNQTFLERNQTQMDATSPNAQEQNSESVEEKIIGQGFQECKKEKNEEMEQSEDHTNVTQNANEMTKDPILIKKVPGGAEKAEERKDIQEQIIDEKKGSKELLTVSRDEAVNEVQQSEPASRRSFKATDSCQQTEEMSLEHEDDPREKLVDVSSSVFELSEEKIKEEIIDTADNNYKLETAPEKVEAQETGLQEPQPDDKLLKGIETSLEEKTPQTINTSETSPQDEVEDVKLDTASEKMEAEESGLQEPQPDDKPPKGIETSLDEKTPQTINTSETSPQDEVEGVKLDTASEKMAAEESGLQEPQPDDKPLKGIETSLEEKTPQAINTSETSPQDEVEDVKLDTASEKMEAEETGQEPQPDDKPLKGIETSLEEKTLQTINTSETSPQDEVEGVKLDTASEKMAAEESGLQEPQPDDKPPKGIETSLEEKTPQTINTSETNPLDEVEGMKLDTASEKMEAEETGLLEPQLDDKPLKGTETSLEEKTLQTINMSGTRSQDEEVEGVKLEQTSDLVSQLPNMADEKADKESVIVEMRLADQVEETRRASHTVSESKDQCVEEIDETQRNITLEDLEEEQIKEEIEGNPGTVSEDKCQCVEVDSQNEITISQSLKAENSEGQLQKMSIPQLSEEQEQGITTGIGQPEADFREENETPQNANLEDSFGTKTTKEICLLKEGHREIEVSALALTLTDVIQKENPNDASTEEGNTLDGAPNLEPQRNVSEIKYMDSPSGSEQVMELTRTIDSSSWEGSKEEESLSSGNSKNKMDDFPVTHSSVETLQELHEKCEEASNLESEKASESVYGVQCPEVHIKLEEPEVKEEHLKAAVTEMRAEEIPYEKEIEVNKISNEEVVVEKKVSEHCQPESLGEEADRKSQQEDELKNEIQNEELYEDMGKGETSHVEKQIIDEARTIGHLHLVSVMDETVKDDLLEEAKEGKNVKETDIKFELLDQSNETNIKDAMGETTALSEEVDCSDTLLVRRDLDIVHINENKDNVVTTDEEDLKTNLEVEQATSAASEEASHEKVGNRIKEVTESVPREPVHEAIRKDEEIKEIATSLQLACDEHDVSEGLNLKDPEVDANEPGTSPLSETSWEEIPDKESEISEEERQQHQTSSKQTVAGLMPAEEKGNKDEGEHTKNEEQIKFSTRGSEGKLEEAEIPNTICANEQGETQDQIEKLNASSHVQFSTMETSEKEVNMGLAKANETIQGTKQLEETSNETSEKQIPREAYPDESKEGMSSSSKKDVQLVPQDLIGKGFQKSEEEPLRASGSESQVRGEDSGGERTMSSVSEEPTDYSTPMGSSMSLSDLLQRSVKETLQVPGHLTEEKVTTANKEVVLAREEEAAKVEEAGVHGERDEEEKDEHKRDDSGSDAPVIVEASRDMQVKDVHVKDVHKKSHNILSGVGSKVKHSIAKVKKAITGKSSHHKQSSPKGTTKVKEEK